MEVPSKEAEYNPRKDSMLVQAAMRLFGGEAGLNAILDEKEWDVLISWIVYFRSHKIFIYYDPTKTPS